MFLKYIFSCQKVVYVAYIFNFHDVHGASVMKYVNYETVGLYTVTNKKLPKRNCYNFWMNAGKKIKTNYKFSKVGKFIWNWFQLNKKFSINIKKYFLRLA